jgi:hypothetical protein
MAIIRRHRPGEFCWTDLGTTDVAGAKKFYQGIFGCKMTDLPMGTGGFKYSMLHVRGRDACALYPMTDDQRKMKAPPFWLPYICVKNAARTITKAKAAGGTVCLGPMDVMDQGRMAILQDPTGASFGIWQPRQHQGAGLDDTPGTVCWHDLNTPKAAAAAKFYAKVFGWKTQRMGEGANAYQLFKLGEKGGGGLWPVPMKQLPPCWVTYWNVADCAKTVAKVKRLGGHVLMDTFTVPGYCCFAVLRDPQGAAFGILEPL